VECAFDRPGGHVYYWNMWAGLILGSSRVWRPAKCFIPGPSQTVPYTPQMVVERDGGIRWQPRGKAAQSILEAAGKTKIP